MKDFRVRISYPTTGKAIDKSVRMPFYFQCSVVVETDMEMKREDMERVIAAMEKSANAEIMKEENNGK